jgi:photosystem II stability/assembly factor-like uncharacterized protein
MKKDRVLKLQYFYIFCISLLLSISLAPTELQAQWKVINPKPFVDDCFIIYADTNVSSVLTSTGNLVSSSDGGNTWVYKYSDKISNIASVFMIDRNNGWAAGNPSTFKTTDGGYSWEDKGDVLLFANWDIYFKDLLNGWSVGNGFVKYTSNGGDTWDTDTIFANTQLQFIAQFDDSVFFTGGNNKLFKSSDVGVTWTEIAGPVGFHFFEKFITVENDSNKICFLLTNGGRIYRSINQGTDWTLTYSDEYLTVTDIKSNNELILTCGFDKVFRSTDIGLTWDTVSVPGAYYKNIYFSNDGLIFISGLNGALIKSTDGGNSFVKINQSLFNEGIASTSFIDSLTGYLSTNIFSPEIYKTTNGGIDFQNITPIGLNAYVTKIHAVSNNMAVAFSDNKILTTKDAGMNWYYSSYGPANTYVPADVYFKDSLNGIVGCGWNLMRETTNGGELWTNRFLGTTQEHIKSISFPDYDFGFYTTGEKLYKTTNGGIDWIFFQNLNPFLSKIKFVDRLNGIGLGNSLYYTNDGGLTWTDCAQIENTQFIDFDVKKNGEGSVLMAIASNYILTSLDLGVTFNFKIIPFEHLTSLTMITPAKAFLYGYYGKLIQYHNPDIVLDITPEYIFQNNYTLSQNYPNPFNPSTKISWQSPINSHQTLKVYDVLGNEVATLLNEYKSAGSYEIDFNASSLSSGIYFYRLQAGSFIQTKKMILLK